MFLRQRSTSLVKSVGDTFPSPLCGGARRALALVGEVVPRVVTLVYGTATLMGFLRKNTQ